MSTRAWIDNKIRARAIGRKGSKGDMKIYGSGEKTRNTSDHQGKND